MLLYHTLLSDFFFPLSTAENRLVCLKNEIIIPFSLKMQAAFFVLDNKIASGLETLSPIQVGSKQNKIA